MGPTNVKCLICNKLLYKCICPKHYPAAVITEGLTEMAKSKLLYKHALRKLSDMTDEQLQKFLEHKFD